MYKLLKALWETNRKQCAEEVFNIVMNSSMENAIKQLENAFPLYACDVHYNTAGTHLVIHVGCSTYMLKVVEE